MSTNYSGNIVLSDATNGQYQNIYASQNYGTFFGVFAKFTFQKSTNKITTLTLKMINYKGTLNLEFIDYEIIQTEMQNKQTQITLALKMKASLRSSGKDEIEIKKADLVKLKVKSNDLFLVSKSFHALNGDSQYDVDRRQKEDPLKPSTHPPLAPFVNGVFDNEFYYRNGSVIEKKAINDNNMNSANMLDGSPSCKQRMSIVYVV